MFVGEFVTASLWSLQSSLVSSLNTGPGNEATYMQSILLCSIHPGCAGSYAAGVIWGPGFEGDIQHFPCSLASSQFRYVSWYSFL